MMDERKTGKKADYRAATFRLPPDVVNMLDAYAEKTGTVKGFIVEQALREWLAKQNMKEQV